MIERFYVLISPTLMYATGSYRLTNVKTTLTSGLLCRSTGVGGGGGGGGGGRRGGGGVGGRYGFLYFPLYYVAYI